MSQQTAHASTAGHHPKYLAHHFESMAQQNAAGKLGMWLFLGQEVLFFSGLFLAYILARIFYPETFLAAHELLDWKLGALNTVFLLTSSLTMALAVRGAQVNSQKQMYWNIMATLILGGAFMVVKYFEYTHKFHDGLLPGKLFDAAKAMHNGVPANIPGAPAIFFAIYFVMTGTHGLHVLIGMGLMIWLLIRIKRGDFNSENHVYLENVGLYWHIVDLIWIFLFPLLYLVR
ncbi:MAG: cytochrome c oxidase subunit 3 family protein [Betaproteobacteria bacterium]|nr:cytochrome c oxidase subunit 3 family protein [Betaproteobacteria bacterium]